MPRTKTQPEPAPLSATINGPPANEVLTLAETAAYLRLPEADVIAAVSTQGLPGRLVNEEWRFLKAALQQWLSVSEPTAEMRNAAMLAMAGAWKDDPDLEDVVEDVYRKRGRPITEDGSFRLFHGLNPEAAKK